MIGLSREQGMLQKTARDFAETVIAPAAAQIDAAAHDAITPWDVIRPAFEKGAALGFNTMLVPESDGGAGGSCIDLCVIMEEIGAADVAVAANYFSLTASMNLLIARSATPAQKARMLSDGRALWSGALSEPNIAGSDLFCPSSEAGIGVQTSARREGEQYVLHGHKSAFVTNAGIADAYIVMARSDFSKPPSQGMTMFYVPKETAGLSFGKRTEMIGWKTAHHTEIYLDRVCVPVENRIGEEGQAGMIFASTPEVSIGLAACYVGLARAAYEYALDYARKRVSWGKPIIQHQAVALKLADMYVQTQSARLLVWDAASACATVPMQAVTLKAPAAKTAAVDAAIHNAQKAVEILGAYGVTREYKTAKFLNDAWIGYACDFTRDMLRLGMVDFL
ncbi:MAG: acyl-CoA dehydrogenase family protein [bacterium]|nr:acyl-CoA dehydrogenase family protein [bacterium]